jgi:hypothetical protein
MSTPRILALGAVALVLYLGFFFGLQAAFPRTEVGYDTALAGRITGTFERKGQRTFFLNGQRTPRYDFDAFVPTHAAGERQPSSATEHSLSQYLRKGDQIRKSGRAGMLTVQRGDGFTEWVCAPTAP